MVWRVLSLEAAKFVSERRLWGTQPSALSVILRITLKACLCLAWVFYGKIHIHDEDRKLTVF